MDFLIVFSPSYLLTTLNDANNDLGKDQQDSGIDFIGSYMQGKTINNSFHFFENLVRNLLQSLQIHIFPLERHLYTFFSVSKQSYMKLNYDNNNTRNYQAT